MTFPRWEVIDTHDVRRVARPDEALLARDEDEWRRLFDIYRRSIELLEKDPNLAALLIQHIRTMRPEPHSPSTRQ